MKTYSKLIVELTKKATTIKWSKPKSSNSGHKGEYIVKSEDGRFVTEFLVWSTSKEAGTKLAKNATVMKAALAAGKNIQ